MGGGSDWCLCAVFLDQALDEKDPGLSTLGDDQLIALTERVEARSRQVGDVLEVGRPVLAAPDADVAGPRLGGAWMPALGPPGPALP
jgi:hypothetical protein